MSTAVPSPEQILAARAVRHHLTPSSRGSSDSDYLEIVGQLGPLRPPSFEFPGTPVVLFDRHEDAAGSSAQEVGERIRRQRLVFKGRFQGGKVAYVRTSDVPIYLAAFRRERPLTGPERVVLEVLESEGPLHKSDLAEVSGVRGRELSAALQRLQEAFLVFEQQLETEWDNAWFSLEREQPEWLVAAPEQDLARLEVLRRFSRAHVATSAQEAKDWSGFPLRQVRELLTELTESGELTRVAIDGWGERFMASDWEPVEPEASLAILDPGDPLVTAQASVLKRKFDGLPALKYVYVDGDVAGIATGRWGIGPFDVDDVVFIEETSSERSRDDIIAKLRRHFPSPRHRIVSFGGIPLDGRLV
ncbi:MAG TPA: crosslink repair DNA glycosylase YcaQ family protein [Trueperaceae bacterium]